MPPFDSLQAAVAASVASRDAIKAAAAEIKAEDKGPTPLPVTPTDFRPAA